MRVLIATNSHDRGAGSRSLEAWARLLPASGVRASVTVGGPGPLLDALRRQGVRAAACPLNAVPRRVWPFPFAKAVLQLAARIRRERADILHLNEHDYHPLAARAARLAGVPIVTHVRFRPGRDYCEWLFRPSYLPARLFFTTETQLHDCEAAIDGLVPRERWRLVPNGLDPAWFGRDARARERVRRAWGLGDATIALGTACAISPRKRVDHFVRLVARLASDGIDVRGYVAGKAYFPQHEQLVTDLRRLAVALGIADRLAFLGYVEPVEPLFYAWDLFVSTSEYESFGMSVLEAMGCGCATVAYPGGAVAEVGKGAARIVPDSDESALFRACRELCLDSQERRRVAEAGRERARFFDARRITAFLADQYRQVLAEQRASGG
jgi:glycosyltransferase involved in cell wall biosynthesis